MKYEATDEIPQCGDRVRIEWEGVVMYADTKERNCYVEFVKTGEAYLIPVYALKKIDEE